MLDYIVTITIFFPALTAIFLLLLNDRKKQSVLLPPGVGNSFCVLSDYTIFMYKWAYIGEYYDVDKQFTIKWDDPKLNINWPIENPILSERDK